MFVSVSETGKMQSFLATSLILFIPTHLQEHIYTSLKYVKKPACQVLAILIANTLNARMILPNNSNFSNVFWNLQKI